MTANSSRPADYWPISTNNVALILVDMQNIWVHPRGARYLPSSEDIVAEYSRAAATSATPSKLPVIYLHTTKRQRSWPMSVSSPTSSRKPMTPTMSGAISKARRARKSTSR